MHNAGDLAPWAHLPPNAPAAAPGPDGPRGAAADSAAQFEVGYAGSHAGGALPPAAVYGGGREHEYAHAPHPVAQDSDLAPAGPGPAARAAPAYAAAALPPAEAYGERDLGYAPAPRRVQPRIGQWSREEEAYAAAVGRLFVAGRVPNCPEGTTLRALMAQLLNCAPMRVSKKLGGELAIGKRLYRHAHGSLVRDMVPPPPRPRPPRAPGGRDPRARRRPSSSRSSSPST